VWVQGPWQEALHFGQERWPDEKRRHVGVSKGAAQVLASENRHKNRMLAARNSSFGFARRLECARIWRMVLDEAPGAMARNCGPALG